MMWKMKHIFLNAFESMVKLSWGPRKIGRTFSQVKIRRIYWNRKAVASLKEAKFGGLNQKGKKYEWNRRTGV